MQNDDMTNEDLLDGESAEEAVAPVSYQVTSYGSDPEVEGLVTRMRRRDIIVPPFQRDYVWRQPEASRFIESLLLGLPVPGIFFAVDLLTNKQLVIDGQQRLKSLLFFYDGFFNPKPDDQTKRVFALTKVQPHLEGRTYKTLDESDRIRLDTSIIHATIVKQLAPPDSDTSLYHIFERLNSGGRRLTPQEMRLALYHGPLIECLKDLNTYPAWRQVFGPVSPRLKDHELILRFFAFREFRSEYTRPMSEFLNKAAARLRTANTERLGGLGAQFKQATDYFVAAIGEKPFRIARTINVAVFDSCMVGLVERLLRAPPPDHTRLRNAYARLMQEPAYLEAVTRSTADDAFVARRMTLAINAFADC